MSFDAKSDIVRNNKLCFSCLKPGHVSRTCTKKLSCSECNGKYPTVMHSSSPPSTSRNTSTVPFPDGNAPQPTPSSALAAQATTMDRPGEVLSPILPAKVKVVGGVNEVIINIILDSASSDCWASESLISKLNLKTQTTSLKLTTMERKKF